MLPEQYVAVLERVAEKKGWKLNPDKSLVLDLAAGLLKNRERYGYGFCPCRTVTGDIKKDKQIICPCVYAPDDIREYGRCYCGLFVSPDVAEGKRNTTAAIPDRHFEKYFTE